MQNILVFGGTFNPVHNGHTRLCSHFARRVGAEKALIILSKISPHKRPMQLAGCGDRLAMCKLAFAGDPIAVVSDIELRRDGVSYTADTLVQLAGLYPDARFYLVVGSDMFFTLDQWHEAQKITELAAVCTFARHPNEYSALLQKKQELVAKFSGEYIVDNESVLEISSTKLRALAGQGGDLTPYMPEAVARYIKTNGLYLQNEI